MAPPISLAGRTVVVTGAASGMGRALAQRLGRQGCPVAAFDWDEDGLRETVDALDGPVLSRKLDVRDRQGRWFQTIFGNDEATHFREKPGIVRIDFDARGHVVVHKDQPFLIREHA